jgi:hypothetical protein
MAFHFLKIAALIFSLGAGLQSANAQECASQNVIVNVIDPHGLPVSNLSAKNFKASSNSQPLDVVSANFVNAPATRTFVLLDTDASMGGFGAQGVDKWKIARAAASEFLGAADPKANVSLLAFSETAGKQFSSSDGRQPMLDWLNTSASLRSSSLNGKTALDRTLLETARAIRPIHLGDAVYVITDARNNPKDSIAECIADELQSSGVRLYSFVLDDVAGADQNGINGVTSTTTLPPPAGLKELTNLVRGSGGFGYTMHPMGARVGQSFSGNSYHYDDRTRQTVRVAAYEIEAAITNFYILTVGLPPHSPKLENWKLEVVDDQGKERKNLSLGYPGRLAGCAANPANSSPANH